MQIRNNIGEQYKKKSVQKPSMNGEQSSSNKRGSNMDFLFERIMTDLKNHMDMKMALIPQKCAEVIRSIFYMLFHVDDNDTILWMKTQYLIFFVMQEVLKLLNTNGVMYKPTEASESDKGGDGEDVKYVPSES